MIDVKFYCNTKSRDKKKSISDCAAKLNKINLEIINIEQNEPAKLVISYQDKVETINY